MPKLTGVKFDRWASKTTNTIVTIELSAFDLCRIQSFIKIEAFAVLCPKLWPKWWQVPTLTGVKNHRKLLSSMNLAPSNCSLCKISWKMVNPIPCSPFPFFKDSLKISIKIWQLNSFNKKWFMWNKKFVNVLNYLKFLKQYPKKLQEPTHLKKIKKAC